SEEPGKSEEPEVPGTGDGDKKISYVPNGSFLGMRAWYDGLVTSDGQFRTVTDTGEGGSMKLSAFIWTIAANVAIDLAVIAAFGAIGFVLYGGYLYMFSGGDTGKVAGGKKTIMNAIIGLIIAMLANVIFTTMKTVLMQGGDGKLVQIGDGSYALVEADPGLVATDLISWVVGVAGVVCVVFLVYGAVSYVTSSGDSAKTVRAKNAILYSLIGLAIVGLAQVITATVANTIRDAKNKTSSIETTQLILAKEENEKQIN
ncbi:MAG: pilin, partial [Candidatus Saccharibacteria bacterium]|nr:pilin [Candidatus Saccharibacteria bacterium]